MKMNQKKSKKIWLLALFVTLVVLIAGCAWYLGDYYRADASAIQAFIEDYDNKADTGIEVTRYELADGDVAYIPSEISAGFIFYPGGKVEHTAYEPLMMACAKNGILSIVVEVPFRLAVFDINAADNIQALYPEVEKWYIGGHSLGGSMAASYLADHASEYEGLILLASYSTVDLSDTDLEILSLYGDQDGVLNLERQKEYIANINSTFLFQALIENGNHAYFGMYGNQAGDGEGTVGNAEQIIITADEIVSLILE